MFFLDHIVNEKPFLDEKHCLNTVKSVATIKKIGCNVVVHGVDNELLCVNKADYMFYYLEGSKVPNSSNGHVLEERRK